MVMTPEQTAFERGVRPRLQLVLQDKADAVLNFRPDPGLQSRIEELATRSPRWKRRTSDPVCTTSPAPSDSGMSGGCTLM